MRFVFALLILISFSSVHATEAPAAACDEQAAWNRLEEVSNQYRDKIRIPHMMALMSEFYRTPIRAYYSAVKMCPTKKVVKRYIKELQIIGYPNDYLPAMLNGLGTEHGLKMYELGDSWNRELVTPELRAEDSLAEYLHQHIAIMGLPKQVEKGLTLYSVGTGSIIGRRGNSVFVATADHVLRNNAESISLDAICSRLIFHFPSIASRHFNGKALVVADKKVDFAICEVELPADVATTLQVTGLNLSNAASFPENLSLMTMGFNSHNAKPGKAHVERSSDCRLFFDSKESRVLDEKNWALPTGCDAAPGDSGSPVLSKENHEVIGFMVQTTDLKSGASSAELAQMQQDPKQKEALWSELSMLVPVTKIKEALCPSGSDLLLELLRCERESLKK